MPVAQQVLPATPQILQKNRGRISGKEVWRQNLNFASLAAFKIGSTLGPKGAYKLVTYHRGPEMVLKVIDCGRDLLGPKLRRHLSEAISRVVEDGLIDVNRVQIVKKPGGQTDDSDLVRGVIIKKGKAHPSMPDWVDQPKIAFLTKLEFKRLELKSVDEGPFSTKLNITSQEQIQIFKSEEARLRLHLVDIVKMSGANVLICRSKMADRISDQLSRQRIFAMHFVATDEFETAAKATGATIVGNADRLRKEDVGTARRLEIDKIKPEEISILQCDRGAALVLRGGSPELVEELEKTVKRALLILKHSRSNPKVVPGGGAILAELALQLRKYALTFEGREQFAISSFADALEKIPECLSRNSGLDPIDMMIQLSNHHASGQQAMGVGEQGCVDMYDANIIELGSVNRANIHRAYELVSLLLRIDDCFYVKDIPKFHKQ